MLSARTHTDTYTEYVRADVLMYKGHCVIGSPPPPPSDELTDSCYAAVLAIYNSLYCAGQAINIYWGLSDTTTRPEICPTLIPIAGRQQPRRKIVHHGPAGTHFRRRKHFAESASAPTTTISELWCCIVSKYYIHIVLFASVRRWRRASDLRFL